ncbi:hypothetical protein GWI33_019587 [Rhynchophorus ferrugineus]|uniref:Uncharacterized protein n=1 Tax=Rhynchophorus ferrugineus TaxID=354439 RepID=A0A834HVV2_RHYFE|nr:hypothetical protein GWI33_019587 [Rhynchophorus ferrugineus]
MRLSLTCGDISLIAMMDFVSIFRHGDDAAPQEIKDGAIRRERPNHPAPPPSCSSRYQARTGPRLIRRRFSRPKPLHRFIIRIMQRGGEPLCEGYSEATGSIQRKYFAILMVSE